MSSVNASTATYRVQRLPRGENHHAWKGSAANSSTIHAYMRQHHPKAGVCEECGKEGPTDLAYLRHPEPYTRNRDDYAEMCRGCHMRMDEEIVGRTRGLRGGSSSSGITGK